MMIVMMIRYHECLFSGNLFFKYVTSNLRSNDSLYQDNYFDTILIPTFKKCSVFATLTPMFYAASNLVKLNKLHERGKNVILRKLS